MPPDRLREEAPPPTLHDLMGVREPTRGDRDLRRLRFWCRVIGIVNLGSAIPFLYATVAYYVGGTEGRPLELLGADDLTRPWMFWCFLAYAALFGAMYLTIAERPIDRRGWLRFGVMEKALATTAAWMYFLAFGDIGIALPLVLIGTDVIPLFVLVWAIRTTTRLAKRDLGDPGRHAAMRVPIGSAPPARWLLRFVSGPTVLLIVVVLGASVLGYATASSTCRNREAPDPSCELLGSTDLWSLPPIVLWLWGVMAATFAMAMLWAARDVVLRREIIVFGIIARLVPVSAVLVGTRVIDRDARPSTGFATALVVLELLAAAGLWLASRSARASALSLGDPADPIGAPP